MKIRRFIMKNRSLLTSPKEPDGDWSLSLPSEKLSVLFDRVHPKIEDTDNL